jgi:hypothetical protein
LHVLLGDPDVGGLAVALNGDAGPGGAGGDLGELSEAVAFLAGGARVYRWVVVG